MEIPESPQTVGELLRRRRHDLGLYEKDVAALLKVNQWTLIGWESDRVFPGIRHWPRIIEFLGYYPYPETNGLGDRILATHRHLGLSHAELADRLQLDEGTVRLVEKGCRRPTLETSEKLEKGTSLYARSA